jgi:hypothetical protein
VNQENKMTVPAMPAALKKIHRPTLVMKTPIEKQEEREPGRYSIIVPRTSDLS